MALILTDCVQCWDKSFVPLSYTVRLLYRGKVYLYATDLLSVCFLTVYQLPSVRKILIIHQIYIVIKHFAMYLLNFEVLACAAAIVHIRQL